MSVSRAKWGIEDIEVDDDDPFKAATPVAAEADPVADGVPVELRTASALSGRVVALFNDEKALWDTGVRCSLKEQADMTCHACPVRSRTYPLVRLCNIGVEQERVSAELVVERARGG